MGRSRRRLELRAWLISSALALGSGCARDPLIRVPYHLFQPQQSGGYTLLLRHRLHNGRAGFAEVATDTASLASLWTRWMIAGDPPAVDFSRDIVVAWGERSFREHGERLRGIAIDYTGTAGPVAEQISTARPVSGSGATVVSVVTIPQSSIGAERFRFFVPGDDRAFVTQWVDVPRRSSRLPSPEALHGTRSEAAPLGRTRLPEEEPLGRVRGELSLPPPREVAARRLDDGLFVWVVRHDEDTLSVLDSHETLDESLAGYFSGVVGLRMPVRYREDLRRFDGIGEYDEYGQSVAGSLRPALTRYRFQRMGDRIRVGSAIDGQPPVRIRPFQEPKEAHFGNPQVLSSAPDDEVLSLQEATRQPLGQIVTLDAVLVVRGSDGPVLCEPHPVELRCPPGARRVVDARHMTPGQHPEQPQTIAMAPPHRKLLITGPITARVTQGGFSEVRVPPFAEYASHHLPDLPLPIYPQRQFPGPDRTHAAQADMYEHARRFGWPLGDRHALWIETALYGAVASGPDASGVQVGLSGRQGLVLHRAPDPFSWETRRSAGDAAKRILLGSSAELDLRLDWFARKHDAPNVLRIGLQPRAFADFGYAARTASWLGLVLPELGWSWRRGDAGDAHDGYGAWHLPLNAWVFKNHIGVEIDASATWLLRDLIDTPGRAEWAIRLGTVLR